MEIENYTNLLVSEKCTGCSACMNICPVDSIKMVKNNEGFLYPSISNENCIQCKQCYDVCPVITTEKFINTNGKIDCYAAFSKDENIRFESTSGGVFSHLALEILSRGGVVAGAAYREDNLVEHIVVYNKDELYKLRQSKYVQSESGYIYKEIEKLLKNNIEVLFSGTPCQCAALRAYLSHDYDKLYICDFICRGVNSPKVYLAYLDKLEKQYNSRIKRVWFKNKIYGWNNFATKILFENGQEYIADREHDSFMLGYIKSNSSLFMRTCCYECEFKGCNRKVDFTLGDFWGVEKYFPEIDSKNGVSAVIIYTSKGKKLFNNILTRISVWSSNIDDIKNNNSCFDNSVKIDFNKRKSYFNNLK